MAGGADRNTYRADYTDDDWRDTKTPTTARLKQGASMADILSNTVPILVDAVEGAHLLRISERRFHELRREPGFPAAVVLGARSVRWLREELADYARSLPRVGVLNEPAQFQARRAR
jgi:predicted DNA-binding transcriptional regulator AlpA